MLLLYYLTLILRTIIYLFLREIKTLNHEFSNKSIVYYTADVAGWYKMYTTFQDKRKLLFGWKNGCTPWEDADSTSEYEPKGFRSTCNLTV